MYQIIFFAKLLFRDKISMGLTNMSKHNNHTKCKL